MLAPVTYINPLTALRRRRLLPVRGRVLVRAGQSVAATEAIAEANLSPEHVVLDLARGLGVPAKKVGAYLQRQIGEEVDQGAALASRGFLAARVLRAPSAGRVVDISGGQMMLEVRNRPFRLLARVPGTIEQVEAEMGAVIRCTAAWVQGVWGNGPVNDGPLQVLAEAPDHLLTPDEMSVELRGTVVLAGHCNEPSGLELGENAAIRGLILGSLATNLIPLASRLSYPIIVLEGFGQRPINSTAHTLLATNAERETTVNAEKPNRFEGLRPEVVIPLPASGESPQPRVIERFASGQRVRIVRAPHAGEIARIADLPAQDPAFPSGVRTKAAQVEFEDGGKVLVPLANIEVLG